MKNIHLLPTDKPSRLIIYSTLLNEFRLLASPIEDWKHKEGDWYYWTVTNSVQKAKKDNLKRLPKISDGSHKIILTTDHVASDITLYNDYVHVRGIGRVGLWWSKYDKKVCVDHSVGKSFYANTEHEVKAGILNILNSKKD